jgi:hypothetical protein
VQALLEMELAGLEQATSWVRSRRSSPANVADVQGFCARSDPAFMTGIAADIRRYSSFQALLAMSA